MTTDTKTKVKIFAIVVAAVAAALWGLWLVMPNQHRWHIEQEIRIKSCCNEASLVTYVWHYGQIVKMWSDPVTTVNDSTRIKRRMQAQTLIDNLKK